MKKTLTIGLLLILFAFTSQAQEEYFKQNLEKASTEDLNIYLERAQKLKKAGKIVTLIGSASTVAGLALLAGNSESTAYHGFFMSLIGAGVVIIGIPILIRESKILMP